jgi:DNA-directed RNA polymerase subunit RPC12/RpoP
MRWLYKILRLFKCPHKFEKIKEGDIIEYVGRTGTIYIMKCSRCGKIIQKEITFWKYKN